MFSRRLPPFPILACAIIAGAMAGLASERAGAEALLLVEVDTGKVLHAENATYPWYPASVTKLMTTYTTLRAVREGRITLDSLFTVSANAATQAPTKMGFPIGTQVTVDKRSVCCAARSAKSRTTTSGPPKAVSGQRPCRSPSTFSTWRRVRTESACGAICR